MGQSIAPNQAREEETGFITKATFVSGHLADFFNRLDHEPSAKTKKAAKAASQRIYIDERLI